MWNALRRSAGGRCRCSVVESEAGTHKHAPSTNFGSGLGLVSDPNCVRWLPSTRPKYWLTDHDANQDDNDDEGAGSYSSSIAERSCFVARDESMRRRLKIV